MVQFLTIFLIIIYCWNFIKTAYTKNQVFVGLWGCFLYDKELLKLTYLRWVVQFYAKKVLRRLLSRRGAEKSCIDFVGNLCER